MSKSFKTGSIVRLLETITCEGGVVHRIEAGYEFRVVGSIRASSRRPECFCESAEWPGHAIAIDFDKLELVALPKPVPKKALKERHGVGCQALGVPLVETAK